MIADSVLKAQLAGTLEYTRLVELGTIIGYYTAIGNALNVFDVALPAGTAPYFPQ